MVSSHFLSMMCLFSLVMHARADTSSYCEFESVNHVFWFEDLPYYDYNDPGYDDFTPLQVAIANAENIVCGMGAPEDCVQIDKIVPYEVRQLILL